MRQHFSFVAQHPDILATNPACAQGISWPNDGTGHFGQPVRFDTLGSATDVVAADFDGQNGAGLRRHVVRTWRHRLYMSGGGGNFVSADYYRRAPRRCTSRSATSTADRPTSSSLATPARA
jgi:hypothetical protein